MNFKFLIIIPVFLFLYNYSYAGDKWSVADKCIFGSLIAAQVLDGITTLSAIDRGGKIMNTWQWKYGSDQPSGSQLCFVKGIELGIGYIIMDKLPSKWRKVFGVVCAGTLFYYANNNRSVGVGTSLAW